MHYRSARVFRAQQQSGDSTEDGRILLAVSQHKWAGGRFARMGQLYSYYSDDNGRTWRSGTEVANPDSVVTQEPGLVSLSDGRLLMYIRTNAHVQYFAYSSDRGETWSPAEPSHIASPLAPATIVNLPDQKGLLLVWNDNGKSEKRTPLNIAVSRDEGKPGHIRRSWLVIRTLITATSRSIL